MAKIITKGGICSTKNKPMGFQFIQQSPGKYSLGGSFGASGDGIVASDEPVTGDVAIASSYSAHGCRTCGNKYAYICPACGAVVCNDGNGKTNATCPSCKSTLNISRAVGSTMPKATVVSRSSFTVNKGDATDNGPYTKWAGVSVIEGAAKDAYGNAQGSQYDLAKDGGFNGQKIVICSALDYTISHLSGVTKALQTKGFTVQVIAPKLPSPNELESILRSSNQFWMISSSKLSFNSEHARIIRDFFESGHGIYLWGDNDPLNEDVNFLAQYIFPGTFLSGDYYAMQVLSIQKRDGEPGIIANHLISTGITSFLEGNSIAKIKLSQGLKPLVYSSDKNIVTAFYDKDGKRALIDGAFTRLWDGIFERTAGTSRFVVNTAAWLANVERFGNRK